MPKQNKQPIRVAYDISRMSAGGRNGGIKTHHYEFLRHFSEHFGHELALLVFCRTELVGELDFLRAGPYNQIHAIGSKTDIDYRNMDGDLPPLHFYPNIPDKLLLKLQINVLYCGFGFSKLYIPEIPQISLIVDALHKDLPEALTQTEVEFRESWHRKAIENSTLIQTNSKFCVESLKTHYQIPDEKLFHIYLPLHGRFNQVEMGELPQTLAGRKYFFYPANHWPHKNHEKLLEAYALYRAEANVPLDLALTGNTPNRTDSLKNLCTELEIDSHVHFLGHLDLPALKTVWELCEALVFPSLYEGFGLPVLEAMYFQKPVICGDVASLPEITNGSAIEMNPRITESLKGALLDFDLIQNKTRTLKESNLDRFELNKEAKKIITRFRQVSKIQLSNQS